MNIKRIISSLLIAAEMFALTSCGLISVGHVDGVPDGSSHGDAPTHEKTETAEYLPDDTSVTGRKHAEDALGSIGEYDFDGEIVFVAAPEDSKLFADDLAETEDRLTFERNSFVEEKLSVKLVVNGMQENEMREWLKREDKAGADEIDLMIIPSESMAKFAADKTLADLSTVPNFSSELPFIDGRSAEGSSDGKEVYGVSGYASYAPADYSAVYFGKKLLPADELYSLVKSGGWTWDKMLAYADAADGSIATPSSQSTLMDTVFCTSGKKYLAKNGGAPTAAFSYDSLSEIYSIFVELNERGIKTSSYSAASEFIDGQTSFLIHKLAALPKIADSAADFGVLPLPKTDEGGEYVSPAPRDYSMFAVPKDTKNKERSVAVILALNASSEIIRDGYVADVFAKYLRDEQSADMLDLILTTAKTDAAYTLGAVYPEIAAATYDFVYKNRAADEKTFKKQYSSAQTAMKKALEKAKKAIDKVK